MKNMDKRLSPVAPGAQCGWGGSAIRLVFDGDGETLGTFDGTIQTQTQLFGITTPSVISPALLTIFEEYDTELSESELQGLTT